MRFKSHQLAADTSLIYHLEPDVKPRHYIQRWTLWVSATFAVASCLAAGFMIMKTQERNAYLQTFIHQSLDGQTLPTRDDSVMCLSRSIYAITNNQHGVEPLSMTWYERFESTFFFNMSSTVALKYGSYGVHGHYVFGPCGTMSRLLLNSLWDLNIPARKLQLLNDAQGRGGGHTLVEYQDGDKWKVIAVSDSAFVWRNARGEIASTSEIQASSEIFGQIYSSHPGYPYTFGNPKHLNWTKFPAWIYKTLIFVLGEERVNDIETPQIYDHPRLMLLYLCIGIFIVSTTIALELRDRLKQASRLSKTRQISRANARKSIACESLGPVSSSRATVLQTVAASARFDAQN